MKKTIKISILTILFFIVLSIFSTSMAASANISASKTSVKVGESTNITVSINAAAWNVKVSGPNNKSIVGNSDDGENTKKTETIKYTPDKEGTYTFSLSGDVSDGSTNETTPVSGSVKITVSGATAPSNNDDQNTDKPQTKEPTFKTVNEKVYATGDINVRKSYSADSTKLGALKQGEEVTRTGIGDNGWSKVTYNGSTGYIKSSLLTAEQPKKSDDKSLKSLTVTGFEFDPVFDPEITDYSVIVGADVEKIEIKAEANDAKATVNIPEAQTLVDGDNLIKIIVTAEDQTTRTYTINATKQTEESALGLTSLKVEGYTLSPKFSPSVYEYKITIMDQNVNNLNITATSNEKNAKIETTGNTNIKNGENTIIITVKPEDGSEAVTYKIIATKNTAMVTQDNANNWILYAGIGIIVFLIILIIIVIIIAKRKAEYEEDDEEEDMDEEDYSDLYGYSSKNSARAIDTEGKEDKNFYEGLEKEHFNNENLYKEKSEVSEEVNQNNVDTFSSDLNTDNSSGYTGNKNIDYYNNEISNIFDNTENKLDKTSQDTFGYLSTDSNSTDNNEEYLSNEDNGGDNYRPRRSKGKHSK